MSLNQLRRARIAVETVRIMGPAAYTDIYGRRHDIRDDLNFARHNTTAYPPHWAATPLPAPGEDTVIEITKGTTLKAAHDLFASGRNAVVLNFANAHCPCGGFLMGANAQEETLCRASALFTCLKGDDFYRQHLNDRAPRYSSYALYSPYVPVIRDEESNLTPPWPMAFITAAAPNVRFGAIPADELRGIFDERIAKILAIAIEKEHDAIVLGAWGCGAFGNDPVMVADAFAEALHGQYKGQFATVVFAIRADERRSKNFAAFVDRFCT